jgi:hypothetical protein
MVSKPRNRESAANPARQHVAAPSDWRRERLEEIRRMIREADPDVVEEQKWKKPTNPAGVPVWSHDGIICTGETYKNHLRLTFGKGARLKDPDGLFNDSLEGNAFRAIVIHEDDTINEDGLKDLIRAAVVLNRSGSSKR